MIAVAAGGLLAASCDGPQSALVPAGRDAERIADLFGWMAGVAFLIWLTVVGIAVYAMRERPKSHSTRIASLLIIGGGVVFPTVVLTGLLSYGLSELPEVLAPAPEGAMRIEVTGEQWWWRVWYPAPGGGRVELANELQLPIGERVEVRLRSADVIHSFWVPSIAGKMDMIPGRLTRLALEPTRTGVFYGACAEYCGGPHAFMNFRVVVLERPAFDAWLLRQAAPAAEPVAPLAAAGLKAFLANGCGACHTIRGTPASGVIGPDLTHVGSRLTIGAGLLPTTVEQLHRWIAQTHDLKPGVHMPSFGMLPPQQITAIAAYLEGLE